MPDTDCLCSAALRFKTFSCICSSVLGTSTKRMCSCHFLLVNIWRKQFSQLIFCQQLKRSKGAVHVHHKLAVVLPLKLHNLAVFLFFFFFLQFSNIFLTDSLHIRRTCCSEQHISIPILINFSWSYPYHFSDTTLSHRCKHISFG